MKKKAFVKSLLILLPVLAVGLATTGDSVIVFDAAAGITTYYSYFDLIPVTSLQNLPPLAGLLSAVCCICAVVYLIKKKQWSLKGVVGTALAAATAAVIPVMVQGTVKVVPNVGLPVFMLIEYLVACHFLNGIPCGQFIDKCGRKCHIAPPFLE